MSPEQMLTLTQGVHAATVIFGVSRAWAARKKHDGPGLMFWGFWSVVAAAYHA